MKTTFFRPRKGYFSHIFRTFTIRKPLIFIILGVLLAGGCVVAVMMLHLQILPQNVLGSFSPTAAPARERVGTEKQAYEYDYWKKVIEEKPDYVAAYLYLIPLARSLGKNEEAELFVQKVLELDPNNKEVLR